MPDALSNDRLDRCLRANFCTQALASETANGRERVNLLSEHAAQLIPQDRIGEFNDGRKHPLQHRRGGGDHHDQ